MKETDASSAAIGLVIRIQQDTTTREGRMFVKRRDSISFNVAGQVARKTATLKCKWT